MNKSERCLVWYYKHHHVLDDVWPILGWLLLPIFVIIGDRLGAAVWLLFLWYLIFSVVPLGFASALLLVYTRKLGLVEPET